MGKIPSSGKISIKDSKLVFDRNTTLEHLLVNRNTPFSFHLKLFANSNSNPIVYYKTGSFIFDNYDPLTGLHYILDKKSFNYLRITHILPINPKNVVKQIRGLLEITRKLEEIATDENIDFILTTGTTYFNERLAERLGFNFAFTANNKHIFYIQNTRRQKDVLTEPSAPNFYYNIYRCAFPEERHVRKYTKFYKARFNLS